MSDCYLQIDRDFNISEINPAAARWVGPRLENLVGCNIFKLFEKAGRIDRAELRELIESRQQQRIETPSATQPGRWVEADFYPIGTETAILFRDITDRKTAELAGLKAKELLNSALDVMTSEIAILDEAGVVLVANRAWHEFMRNSGKYCQDNGIGVPYLELHTLKPVRSQLHAYRLGVMDVIAGRQKEFQFNFRARAFGGYRNYRLHVSCMDAGRWKRILVARDDVTELETALDEVDNMAVRLVNLQEKERQRYAAELHDSTVQHLTAATLNLMVLRDRIDGKREGSIIASVEKSIAEAQREIRSVSYLLYPRALDEDGLRPTLARFVAGYSSRTDIHVALRTTGPLEALPLPLKRAILRIVQEAMANVHRHACAKSVDVAVTVTASRVSLSVSDDGIGLAKDANGKLAKPGIGISGMRARANQFGGCLKLRSSGRGTLVFSRLPMPAGLNAMSDLVG
jgi:signal transduction histidine kinase